MGPVLTTHRHFCTYFDHRYLPRALALHRSLEATGLDFTLWALALSGEAERLLLELDVPRLRVVTLDALLAHDPDLAAARANRSLVEFYFTCSPCLPRFLLDREPDMAAITYLDSDLYFFSTPEQVFEEIGDASVAITPHRFSRAAARSHARFGAYNVGWVTFRRDANGRACLDWWRDRCLEWCHDRPEPDRYADQKYLERFEQLFDGVHAIAQPGANLAPWNVADARIASREGRVEVDGRPLVFFHFQGLRRLSAHWYDSNLTGYGAHLGDALRRDVFLPYLDAVDDAEARVLAIAPGTSAELGAGVRRRHGLAGLRASAGRAWRTLAAGVRGNLVHR